MFRQMKWKRWTKIWLLNFVIITTFYACLIVVLCDNNSSWEMFNFDTYKPEHIILGVTGIFLLIEDIALLKTKGVDMPDALDDVKDIIEDEGDDPKSKKSKKK